MATLKMMLGALLMPLPVGTLLVMAGLLCKRLGRNQTGRIMFTGGAIIVLAATLGPVANAALGPLENRYRSVLDATKLVPCPHYIVVLGGGYAPRAGLPITAELEAVAMVRLAEAIRLHRQLPGSLLIVSGGAVDGHPPSAHGYAKAAIALGVPAESIVEIDSPVDTGEEIRALHSRIGSEQVLLVTSASHMARAMAHCARQHVNAIPAPTGQLAGVSTIWNAWTWLPSGAQLRKTETALHEYAGLLALSFGVT